jgi:hypothetical protein
VAINKDGDSPASSAVRRRGIVYSLLAERLSLAHSWHADFHARRGKLQISTDWQSVDPWARTLIPPGVDPSTTKGRPLQWPRVAASCRRATLGPLSVLNYFIVWSSIFFRVGTDDGMSYERTRAPSARICGTGKRGRRAKPVTLQYVARHDNI